MLTTKPMSDQAPNDADLVNASLAGNRGAFGQIVARYQSLVCSLAYSSTGSLDRSEDLAQEAFLAAWRQLPALRDPARLRAWLCGITRNLISNTRRNSSREPAQLAGPLDSLPEMAAAEPSPPEQTVSREEEAILWRALERVPETYREPLVLYYREHRSVESVAREMELSEEAVRQRLSRGRALLHDQVLAFVEGTLERSRPGREFMLGVMSALPVLATSLSAGVGGATAQGTAGAKITPWLGQLGTLFTAQVLWFVSSSAFVAGLGGLAGWQMGAAAQSAAERRWALRFWRLLVCGMIVFLLPVLLGQDLCRSHPEYAGVFTLWLGLLYIVPGVPLVLWAIENHRRIRGKMIAAGPALPASTGSLRAWVAAATIGAIGLLAAGLSYSHWSDKIRAAEAWDIIASHPGAEIHINELESGGRWVEIVATGGGRPARYHGPLDEPTFARLKQNGVRYQTRVQGRDYDILGWPGRRLGLVTLLTFGAGAVFLLRTGRRGEFR